MSYRFRFNGLRMETSSTSGQHCVRLVGHLDILRTVNRNGLTPDQRFFVGFAQRTCNNTRPEKRRRLALPDQHSPLKYRINGVVVNMPEFANAFSCKSEAQMTKPAGKACSIW